MHILVSSPSFPTSKTIDFVFVDQLCRAFADLGHEVTVIAPQSVTKCLFRHIPIMPRHSYYKTAKGAEIELFRPYMVSLSNSRFAKLFKNSFQNAVNRAYRKLKLKPDVCYGHFWSSIFALYPLAKEVAVPLCGASGEENVGYYVHSSEEYKKGVRDYLSGVVSVSSKNQQECLSLGLVSPEKSIVIPNAIDQMLFRKLDKDECRHKLGLSKDVFIVSFVGQFVPRKGTLRLNEALKKVDDPNVKAVFIGTGSEDPDYAGIVQKGRVAHDVFVLPTENEGCCNAIIEAMACGLPIISTDASFNHDILNDGNSIMVGCHDVDAIASAIRRLKEDDGLRQRLSEGALATARGLSINQRAQRIIDFMQKQIKQ